MIDTNVTTPESDIIAISNVYIKTMKFKHKGDTMEGHKHTYDHATFLSKGSILIKNEKMAKVFEAPISIFIDKNMKHEIIALEDDTVALCIHAIREVDSDIIPPDSFINQIDVGEDNKTLREILLQKGIDYPSKVDRLIKLD